MSVTRLLTIAVDAMGGDHGPAVVVPAVLDFLAQDPEVAVTLVGLRSPIESLLLASPIYGSVRTRIALHEASQLVSMEESPVLSLKNKKDSSLRVSINLVKSGAADCCVSAGNTGALMATARFVLKMMPGIERPAIATTMPSIRGPVYVLDLGANVDCAPEHLLQFGIMGSILATSPECPQPSVGLLNIGHEAIKGNEIIKRASELLRTAPIRFHGNVEGDDIYKGTVDVVVCDGFVGNVVLKTSEGLAWMLGQMIRTEFNRSFWTRLAGAVALPVLNRFKRRVDHRQYNGASLLGLRGLVVKSHGGADAYAFRHALLYAVTEVRSNVLGRIQEAVQERENLAS
ncbi:phosphate acyltransferase PlsX [Ferrovum myxofaciens]|uniref:Phosphate acyltransferase n=2 Tax=root TaxID=1 RepID=A0A8F3E1X3_9PROT|nr:phosphate acyltransferase PlsX [Ferrovum myxofaciens]KXW59285.1 phosphate acyltransferase [Ferrovum myxofaciens]MBU6993649.1 phosphate acyltransferase PlsX [Ferrovum myxofaciens]QKE39662.2 MAG: phosphate acyltransferase PlsX [Ferrovum myxofaciens]QWY75304.1 MAG: phosphate acyltransferase PlsX [Ferrovum myxofaciens]QWY78044.1 MAG: phosphate acyltransferase PlsX [Ferrovum myxofaciens]